MTVLNACEYRGIKAFGSFADILDEAVAQEAQAKVPDHANKN